MIGRSSVERDDAVHNLVTIRICGFVVWLDCPSVRIPIYIDSSVSDVLDSDSNVSCLTHDFSSDSEDSDSDGAAGGVESSYSHPTSSMGNTYDNVCLPTEDIPVSLLKQFSSPQGGSRDKTRHLDFVENHHQDAHWPSCIARGDLFRT